VLYTEKTFECSQEVGAEKTVGAFRHHYGITDFVSVEVERNGNWTVEWIGVSSRSALSPHAALRKFIPPEVSGKRYNTRSSVCLEKLRRAVDLSLHLRTRSKWSHWNVIEFLEIGWTCEASLFSSQ